MRKDKEQRKRNNASQLKLFSGAVKPTALPIGRTEGDSQPGVELSSRLEKQQTLTSNLLNKIVDYENLTCELVFPPGVTIFAFKIEGVS
jgi:hypothetical protein